MRESERRIKIKLVYQTLSLTAISRLKKLNIHCARMVSLDIPPEKMLRIRSGLSILEGKIKVFVILFDLEFGPGPILGWVRSYPRIQNIWSGLVEVGQDTESNHCFQERKRSEQSASFRFESNLQVFDFMANLCDLASSKLHLQQSLR